ncbi:MAG: ABC transporter ATP-binding protein/permease [Actinobacteria bacterium]|nr:ABC transporter ATP-binding protein/permease [Actinomycetota bacterium]
MADGHVGQLRATAVAGGDAPTIALPPPPPVAASPGGDRPSEPARAPAPAGGGDGPRLRLRPFLRPHRGLLGGAAVLTVAEALLDLARPWPLKLAVDHAIGHRPLHGRLAPLGRLSPAEIGGVAAALTVALVGAGAVVSFGAVYLGSLGSERVGADLRSAVHRRLLQLSVPFHDRHRSGELATRLFDDVGRVQDSLTAWLTTLVPEGLTLVGMVVVMLLVDAEFSLAALSVVPPLALAIALRRRRIRTAQRRARDEEGRLAAQATDTLRNVRAVQAFGREALAQERFDGQNQRAVRASVRAMGLEARYTPLADIILAAGAAFVLWLGVVRVTSGRLTLGLLLVLLSYLASLYEPIRSLSRLGRTMARAAASRERIDEVMSAGDVVTGPRDPVPVPAGSALVLDDVWFAYRPGTPVLQGLSLSVAAGETLCIVGPTGAGKSTLLNLLLRFYDPDSGAIRLDAIDLRLVEPAALRQRLALVPQDPWILDGTIADNIAFGRPDATYAEVREAAGVALVDEFALALPDGYDTLVGEAGVLLSGGQRRRVALARAVLRQSPILLLDEPTSGLDAASEAEVMEALRLVTVGRTVVMVSHRLGLAAAADRVAVLGRGRVLEEGTPRRLLALNGEFAYLRRLQAVVAPSTNGAPTSTAVIEKGGDVHGRTRAQALRRVLLPETPSSRFFPRRLKDLLPLGRGDGRVQGGREWSPPWT